ncbi:MAG: RNA polymerase sigma factor [Chitinophagaceae bacterium]
MFNLSKLSDEKLFVLIAEHHEDAVATLLNRYKNKIYTTAYLLVKDKYVAEDIFQEVCIKAINKIRQGEYKEDGKLLAWVSCIARNMAIDYLRVSKRRVKVTMPDGSDIFSVLDFQEKNQEDKMIDMQSHKKVRHMIGLLSEEQREVIVLRMYGNMSFKDIATVTNTSVNTALGRMRYALMNLRKLISEKEVVL